MRRGNLSIGLFRVPVRYQRAEALPNYLKRFDYLLATPTGRTRAFNLFWGEGMGIKKIEERMITFALNENLSEENFINLYIERILEKIRHSREIPSK